MYSLSLRKHVLNFKYISYFYVALSFLMRIILFFWSGEPLSILVLFNIFIVGLMFDLISLIYISMLWLLLGFFSPSTKKEFTINKIYSISTFILISITVAVLLFTSVAELTFWNEFSARFNFIAVDYLVYTNEVIKNIWESYPVFWVLIVAIVFAIFISYFIFRKIQFECKQGFGFKARVITLLLAILIVTLNYQLGSLTFSNNLTYSQKEISKNGLYSLFSAYFNNELDYDRFYMTQDLEKSFYTVRSRLASEGRLADNSASISREISSITEFKPYNVILVSMESMSARFMKAFGSTEDITPVLDKLTTKGLFFKNVFATGTRTVRGLEALMLSVPPTPGQSILRRPKNENLYNIGDYLEDVGYEAEFLYGGYGYFDNMNAFFRANSFSIWDQSTFDDGEIHFKNAWGVSDEDLFSKAIKRADSITQSGKSFFQVIMTTSNHRPYTYPQKIDIPSGSGRSGAVKYADFAIGEFLRQAQSKSWYENTIFIFVADHNASVGGNIAVPIVDFRIPFIVFAPKLIKPQVIIKLGSQIDVAPTILGLLGARYTSHFFGHDLLKTNDERAFLGTYQKVGLLRENILTILGPNKTVEQFEISAGDVQLTL